MGWTPYLEIEKSVKSPPPEKEGAAEIMRDELSTAPISCLPELPTGRIQEYS